MCFHEIIAKLQGAKRLSALFKQVPKPLEWAILALVSLLGGAGWTILAVLRNESVNGVWFVITALCSFTIAYRFYAKFITKRILQPDDSVKTPAEEFEDGHDFEPTKKAVTFGHHFAAIAGAGPLVGPILAAQMGYLPSTLWIIIGVILAGGVQDVLSLWISVKSKGRTLNEIVRDKLGTVPSLILVSFIIVTVAITLSYLAMVCINALAESPWAVFSVAVTIPIAVFMGVYVKFLRPGKVGETTVIGVVLLILGIFAGQLFAQSEYAPFLHLTTLTLSICMIIYAVITSVLPSWVLSTPRNYLSSFLKIGVIGLLAVGILIARPEVHMPAFTPYAFNTSGPVFAGSLFPFLFITIACGALSGVHSLIASGTTPKMLAKESHIRSVGYGAMLVEAFVAIIALTTAISVNPGVYFSMNTSGAQIQKLAGASYEVSATREDNAAAMVEGISQQENLVQLDGTPVHLEWEGDDGESLTGAAALHSVADDVGEESVVSRSGGAPTLAVGMANILQKIFGGRDLFSFWYHFAILFEALFILAVVESITRISRFQMQDLLLFSKRGRRFSTKHKRAMVILTTLASVAVWGSLLVMGVLDPNGGIRVFLPLFGIANQLMAVAALTFATYFIVQKGLKKLMWVPLIPCLFAVSVTFSAAWQKLFSRDLNIGFWAAYDNAVAKISAGVDGEALTHAQITAHNSFMQGTLMYIMIVLITLFIAICGCKTVQRLVENPTEKAGGKESRARSQLRGKSLGVQ